MLFASAPDTALVSPDQICANLCWQLTQYNSAQPWHSPSTVISLHSPSCLLASVAKVRVPLFPLLFCHLWCAKKGEGLGVG